MAEIGDYRYRIPGNTMPDVTAQNMVNFDVFVEVCTENDSGDVWELVQNGHFTQPVPCVSLEACANEGDAWMVIGNLVKARGLAQSDHALRSLLELLSNGIWPETDVINTLTLD